MRRVARYDFEEKLCLQANHQIRAFPLPNGTQIHDLLVRHRSKRKENGWPSKLTTLFHLPSRDSLRFFGHHGFGAFQDFRCYLFLPSFRMVFALLSVAFSCLRSFSHVFYGSLCSRYSVYSLICFVVSSFLAINSPLLV